MNYIGILTGGGDCAGLNAVIAAVVKSGSRHGLKFKGIIKGFEGLLDDGEIIDLTLNKVDGITSLGGTIIQTTNKGRFSAKVGNGENSKIPDANLEEAMRNLRKENIDKLIVIGGDGSLSAGLQLAEKGIDIIAVPKTIDNDLCETDYTFGFSSAVDFVAESMDRIHTTAESHNRLIIVETMGRNAGWIALHGGISGEADIILIPEIKYNVEKIVQDLRARKTAGKKYSIIVIAEGAMPITSVSAHIQSEETGKENLLGGISARLVESIEQIAQGEFEMRNLVLGHLQRGGSPNAYDRLLAQRFGVAAVQMVLQNKRKVMVALKGTSIESIPLEEAVCKLNLVDPEGELVRTARNLGIGFGD